MANIVYQQGTQRIEIVVRKEGGRGGSDTNAKEIDTEDVAGSKTDWKTKLTGSSNPNRQARVFKTNLTHALAVSKQVADLVVEYVVSGIGDRNGDQALQEQAARKVEIVKDTTGFVSSVGMGTLYGAWGGPIGAILGAAFGAVSSGASLIAKYKGRERTYDYKVFKENNAIEYQRSRANINLTFGRLR